MIFMGISLIFPGQGSQKIGMCAAFFTGFKSGIETMEEIEDAISFKISSIITDGSEEELKKTENAQLAIFAASITCLMVLKKEFGISAARSVRFMAGHSLGEYTALCAASAMSLSSAAKLVQFRGKAMSKAYTSHDASMVAILGLDVSILEKLVANFQNGRNVCVIANDNIQGQVVLSGQNSAIEKVCTMAKEIGAKKAIKLSTSGPFHSPLMASAAIDLDQFLTDNLVFQNPEVPIVMNVVARSVENGTDIHDLLVSQITSRVRWRESMQFLFDNGIDTIIEIGPGRVLTGMLKRASPDIRLKNVETATEMEEVAVILDNEGET